MALADHDRISDERISEIIVRGIKSIKEHEAFDPFSFNNDIAVLELDLPVDFDSNVQPACLPTSGKEKKSFCGKFNAVFWFRTQ